MSNNPDMADERGQRGARTLSEGPTLATGYDFSVSLWRRRHEQASQGRASQANVSKTERQNEVYLSTIQRYVTVLCGHLRVSAVFGDEEAPLDLAGARGRANRKPEAQE